MTIETVEHVETLAHIFRHSLKADGVKFLTPSDYSLQLGLIEHPTGKEIRDHIHRQDIKYKVDTTQEFLYIESGSVEVTLYTNIWKVVKQTVLNAGDFILFVSGGHGLKVLKKCRIIEIKQGPYPGDKDAKIYRDEPSSH